MDSAPNDRDKLFGGRGDDLVTGVNGDNNDIVNCGPGEDFFAADPGDKVNLATCENPF